LHLGIYGRCGGDQGEASKPLSTLRCGGLSGGVDQGFVGEPGAAWARGVKVEDIDYRGGGRY